MVGRTISHYKIVERLGRGGMGEVWKAEDTKLRRTVALKFLSPEAFDDQEVKQRLVREAQASASLDHPNICHVHGIDDAGGETFIAMAFIDGPSLADKIKERPLPFKEALELTTQIAEGLQEAHGKGIVHRDIKPANVMLTAKGQVKIMDFGLASQAGRSKITKEGATLGTPAYMAPEQLEGGEVDQRADLWALGCVLYEMLTQQTPFEAEYEQAIAYGILNEEPEPVTAMRGGLPPEIDQVIEKALSKERSLRYQSAADFAADLKRLQNGRESRASRARSKAREAEQARQERRKKLGWAAAAAAVVATALGAGWYLGGGSNAAPEGARRPPEYRQVTFLAGSENSPVLSPFGDRFTFDHDRKLWVQTVGAAEPVLLDAEDRNRGTGVWSPDGQQFAYPVLGRGSAVDYWTVRFGGRPTKLADSSFSRALAGTSSEVTIDWSPDGKYLALLDRLSEDTPNQIVLFELSSGRKQAMTSPPPGAFGDVRPAFSPDGAQLAFARRRAQGVDDVYVVDLPSFTGAADAAIPAPRQVDFEEIQFPPTYLDWAPDGEALVISTGKGLFRLPLDGSPSQFLLEHTGSFSMAADGSVIALKKGDGSGTAGGIKTVPGPAADGDRSAPPRPLIQSSDGKQRPVYSPDGTMIAWDGNRLGKNNIWVADADGSNPRQLTNQDAGGIAFAAMPEWSPDSRTVAFAAAVEIGKPSDVYTVSVDGGVPQRITEDPALDVHPSFSADGEWIYFGSERTGQSEVWKIPVAGGPAVQVTTGGGRQAQANEEFIYYTKPNVAGLGMWRIPVAGGPAEQFLEGAGLHARWDLWKDRVCTLQQEDSAILCFSTEDGLEVYAYHLDPATDRVGQGLGISPDGKLLVASFGGRRSQSDIYLVTGLGLEVD